MPPFWWRDKTLFLAELEKHPSVNAMADAHGMSEAVLRKWRKRHGIPARPKWGPRLVVNEQPDDEWLLKALKKRGDNASVEDLADHADVSPRKVREALDRLGVDGYRVAEEENRVVLRRVPPPSANVHKALFKGSVYRYGVVSDTHLGSKHEQLDALNMAYDVLADEGITDVYHPGDLVCGYGIFPGQNNEVHKHTYEDQVAYATANYPQRKGIVTKLIGGNHDLEGAWGKAGANPCVAVCNQRPDIEYLGDYNATIELEQGTRIQLLHPKGSMGYAMDYKARKLVEGYEGGRKPNVLLSGHFHRIGWIVARSVHVLFSGCFEAGGSFGPRLGLPDPVVGFYVVEMTVADDGSVVRFVPEFRQFFPGRAVAA